MHLSDPFPAGFAAAKTQQRRAATVNELEKDLRAMSADGAAWSVMVGVGETYLPAFVLALSANQTASGLVATLPLVVGAVLQLLAPYAVRRIGSYRTWIVLGAIVQAVAFLPLVAAAALGAMPVPFIFAIASVYWAAGMATGPAWNAWVETLVPKDIRARYFARRTRLTQVGLLFGFMAGGLLLQLVRFPDPLTGFALLFLVAAAARAVSAYCLSRHSEPEKPAANFSAAGWREWRESLHAGVDVRALLFLLGMQMAVWIAGPYFAAYMFVHLKLSYGGFMVLTCMAVGAKIVCLPLFGQAVERWGANRVLWTSGLAIAVAPALWTLGDGFVYLALVQVLAGTAWGAYELAMLLTFFDSIPRESRIRVLTLFNVASASAIVAGSLIGAAVLGALGTTIGTYMVLFLLSAGVRAASLLLLVRLPRLQPHTTALATRPVALGPSVGAIERPILPSLAADDDGGRQEPGLRLPAELDRPVWETEYATPAAVLGREFADCSSRPLPVVADPSDLYESGAVLMGTRPRTNYVLKLKARRCSKCGAKLSRHQTRCVPCHALQAKPAK